MRLKGCLLSVPVLLAISGSAWAENWKLPPGETKTYYDVDFTRVDQSTGLVVTRIAEGKPNGPYKSWPAGKGPILMFALDCAADKWMDLGMDFEGGHALPKGWRKEAKVEDISGAVGKAGKLVCETKDSLPTVALP
ncbi:hypothetical protein [Caulobacter sp. RHG1]|uniref:hypothetical protein n=1 Tax=Caulobacter sp. (strain RHG1) TaxID=2545762 RepID=UPI00155229B5|nr:hypothetical protein [Caulobacter sp. RHG1]NQE63884.1 hypothetical protein [Caulobacter sp. RHG1]